MKAHYFANKSEYKKMAYEVAKEEIERQKEIICPMCEQSIGNQVAAVICKVLHDNYGFGKTRLQQIITDAESLFELCAVDGKRFCATQCVDWLRDAMGIDLNKGE